VEHKDDDSPLTLPTRVAAHYHRGPRTTDAGHSGSVRGIGAGALGRTPGALWRRYESRYDGDLTPAGQALLGVPALRRYRGGSPHRHATLAITVFAGAGGVAVCRRSWAGPTKACPTGEGTRRRTIYSPRAPAVRPRAPAPIPRTEPECPASVVRDPR